MAGTREDLPRFAFSRRDPSAILGLARQRRLAGSGVRMLALGGQPRDRIYCAQLLAEEAGQTFVQLDLALDAEDPAKEKAGLERLLAFARVTPTTLCLDGAESLFSFNEAAPGERAKLVGGYLKRTLATFEGNVVFGMPEQVEADYPRLPDLDMEVTFRAPSGRSVAARPLLLPSRAVGDDLLPTRNFRVDIDGVEVGFCAVSAPQLIAGPYSEFDFNPEAGVQGFQGLEPGMRSAWPTITLRRAVSRSKRLYAWKQAQYGGKPLVRNLLIRQLDWPARRVVNSWSIEGCWPKRWSGPDFDAIQGALAEEELELYYQKVVWL